MSPTLFRAGRATHLKIVLVSLVAAVVVVVVGINARTGRFETAGGPTIIKAQPAPSYADKNGGTVR